MAERNTLEKALDLFLRLPPQIVSRTFNNVIKLRPELEEDLSSAIDRPLKCGFDSFEGKHFILSSYNQDEDSFRSPWSNRYFPHIPSGIKPSIKLRKLEVKANEAFQIYTEMYYEHGLSSVYCWELDDGFAMVVLLKKVGDNFSHINGKWDSIHVIQVNDENGYSTYKITSTIMLSLHTRKLSSGIMNISGSISRQNKKTCKIKPGNPNTHIINIGELVEEMENQMRHSLYDIYFWKTKDITTRYLRYCVRSETDQRRLSKMLDFKLERSRSAVQSRKSVHRSPSGKHLLVPMQNSFKV